MKLSDIVVKNIIRKLINGADYRPEVLALIDAAFLQYVMDFFEKIAIAKIRNQPITTDWYKAEFLDAKLSKTDIAVNSGLNIKTIDNSYGSTKKEIVIEAATKHYETLLGSIEDLIKDSSEFELALTIKHNKVSVELNISESLIVINTIAVKRAALRGGAWSTAGKQVEKPLLRVLCQLFQVPTNFYDQSDLPHTVREIDFFLKDVQGNYHSCEVKLMGKGNPESADGAMARNVKVFIADKLSKKNKQELDRLNILWVEFNQAGGEGYKRFGEILANLNIPHILPEGDSKKRLEEILVKEDEITLPDLLAELEKDSSL
jgi:CfrBI restriction endonuclease